MNNLQKQIDPDDVTFSWEFLKEWFSMEWLLNLLKDFFFWMMQVFVDLATFTLGAICSVLPSFDFAYESVLTFGPTVETILSYIAWLFPFDVLLFCITIVCVNYTAYFTVGTGLRWIKATS